MEDETGKKHAISKGDDICDWCHRAKSKHTMIGKDPKTAKFQCVPGHGLYKEEFMATVIWSRRQKELDSNELNEKAQLHQKWVAKAKQAETNNTKFDPKADAAAEEAEKLELTKKWDFIDAKWKSRILDSKMHEYRKADAHQLADETYETAVALAETQRLKAIDKADDKSFLGYVPKQEDVVKAQAEAQTKYNEAVKAAATTRDNSKGTANTTYQTALTKIKEQADAAEAKRKAEKDKAEKEKDKTIQVQTETSLVSTVANAKAEVEAKKSPPVAPPVAPPAEAKK
jgi:hypothetical protein